MSNDLHALVGPYIVDALDDSEREAFETHLLECDSCAEEMVTLAEVPALLASSVAVPVPADLRASVLAEVDRTPQELPLRPRQPIHAAPNITPAAPRSRFVMSVLAVAAAVVVVVGAIGVMSVRSADERARDAESALSVFEASDRATASFEGELGSIEVTTSVSAGRTVVTGHDVPDLDAGRTYELWFVDEDGPVPAGTFTTDGGSFVHRVDGVAPETVAITNEPEGGSAQPTGPILAAATIGA